MSGATGSSLPATTRRAASIAALWLAAILGGALPGCAVRPRPAPPPAPAGGEYPGTLVPPSSVPGDFIARQELRASHGATRVRLESVLQKRGDTITLLGLTPLGTRAFLLQQEGVSVTFTPYLDRPLPFPPRYMLIDIHRALFIGIGPGPLPDGVHAIRRGGEEIRERWQGGRLVERTFRRESGVPPGLITVTCEEGMQFGVPPRELTFKNGWFGYELTITTRSYETLAPSP